MNKLLQQRLGFEALGNSYSVAPNINREDIVIANVPCAWFTPANALDNNIVIFIHGGGFMLGSLNSHAPLVSNLAATLNRKILAIDYHLAPEHTFPSGLEDCVAVIKTVAGSNNNITFGIMGDSAGGNLAIVSQLLLRDQDGPMPQYSIVISPVTDFAANNTSYTANKILDTIISREYIIELTNLYAPGEDFSNPLLSPVNAEFYHFPPTLIMCGTYEVLLDDSIKLYKRMLQFGVAAELDLFEAQQHVWLYTDIGTAAAQKALQHINRFVLKHTGS